VLLEEAELFGSKAWESALLKSTGLPTIECAKSEGTGSLESEGKRGSTVTYKECKVLSEPKCEVGTPVVAEEHGQLVEVAGKIEVEVTAKNKEVGILATITLKDTEGNSCATKGTYDLKGKQLCLLVKASVGEVVHKTECLPSGSELTVGGKKAEYMGGEEVKALSGKAWLVE
jgi:hypothetical protein